MRAAVYDQYGPPSVLSIADVPTPSPKAGEVLVRVHAASINSWDWDLLVGNALGRLGAWSRPRHKVLGADIAGIVEALGEGVTRFAVGDAVVAEISEHGWGGFAEYVAVPETVLVRKPEALSFAEAAAVPQAGTLALQALRVRQPIAEGETVLINGGGGGMGTFGIQLARHFGATVVASDRGEKLELMASLGAEQVFDYRVSDYRRLAQRYDRIVDPVARGTLRECRDHLTERGTFVGVGGTIPALLRLGLGGPMLSRKTGRWMGLLIWRPRVEDIAELLAMCAAGTIKPVVDRVYPLAEIGAAMQRVGDGSVLGKVIVGLA
jgi:NADPH:quinone reductase-like Zn-dependent oxidoreductase